MTVSRFLESSASDKSTLSRGNTKSEKPTLKNRRSIPRAIVALREHLFDEMDALYNGESHPHEAAAFAELASKVLDTVEMEMKHKAFQATMAERKLNQMRLLPAPQKQEEPVYEEETDL